MNFESSMLTLWNFSVEKIFLKKKDIGQISYYVQI